MNFKYKFFKYKSKNKHLLNNNNSLYGGELTDEKNIIIKEFINLYDNTLNSYTTSNALSYLLHKLISKHKWLHCPSIYDIGMDIFMLNKNPFDVTKYWHSSLDPHNGNDSEKICKNCSTFSKFDKRVSLENPQVNHHVDQHLFKISDNYLYTYHLVTCSALILIQNNKVGLMHIDASNTSEHINEFINTFENNVGEFDETLQIHGFFNNEIYDPYTFDILIDIYGLILEQYNIYGHKIFSNVFINLPKDKKDKPYIPRTLYIFAFPTGEIKGFYVDENSNIEKYVYDDNFIYVHEQQCDTPDNIIKKLKNIYTPNQIKIFINTINNSINISESDAFDFLNYAISSNKSVYLIKLHDYLINTNNDPSILLKKPN